MGCAHLKHFGTVGLGTVRKGPPPSPKHNWRKDATSKSRRLGLKKMLDCCWFGLTLVCPIQGASRLASSFSVPSMRLQDIDDKMCNHYSTGILLASKTKRTGDILLLRVVPNLDLANT